MENLKLIDCTKKKLDDTYIIMYAIKNELNMKKGETIESIDVYTLIGINKKGIRQLVGIYQDKPQNSRHWLDIFGALKSRGLQTILFLTVDDNKNFKRTVKMTFPMITFVDSLTYIVPKFYKYTTEKSTKDVYARISRLFTEPTLNDYKAEMDDFKSEYNNTIHQKLIEKYLKNVEICYKYSYNIRALLFKTSANFNIYERIRLSFNSNESYINDISELYSRLESADRVMGFTSYTKSQWTHILNDLMQLYPDIEFI